MIGGRRPSRLSLLLPARFPARAIGEIGAHFANRVFDHRAAVGKGHPWKALLKVPRRPGMGMGCRFDCASFSPTKEIMCRDDALTQLQVIFTVVAHLIG